MKNNRRATLITQTHTHSLSHKHMQKYYNTHTHILTQTDRQTDRHTHTHTHTHSFSSHTFSLSFSLSSHKTQHTFILKKATKQVHCILSYLSHHLSMSPIHQYVHNKYNYCTINTYRYSKGNCSTKGHNTIEVDTESYLT